MARKKNVGTHNKELLQEIRDNIEYDSQMWKDIKDEGKKDMRYLAGDPWDPREKESRSQIGSERPCLVFDELNQYVNQLNNDVRQNKRAIRVIPTGSGANDKSAALRGGIIRNIEYKSNAQSAYSTAFENATGRSYGYFRLGLKYANESGFDREPVVRRINNPDSVLLDWNAMESDYSDGDHASVIDQIDRKKFKKKWPKARMIDFASDECVAAPSWFGDPKRIQIAEYWKVEKEERKLLLLNEGSSLGLKVFLDGEDSETAKIPTLPKGSKVITRGESDYCVLPPGWMIVEGIIVEEPTAQGLRYEVIDQRKSEQRRVVQYITNGVEILEENEWPGQWIPIIPVFGRELWVDRGKGPERVLMSLIRLARDPYMLYCWLRSNQQEEAGMTPKVPWIVVKGQLEGCDGWGVANRIPQEFLEYLNRVDGMGPGETLPAPERQPFTPNFAPYEVVIESVKRGIQSALGRYNASVGKHDSSAQSGVAIKALDQQSDQGSFHFIDNYNKALEFAGRQLNELISLVIDRPRDVGVRKPDDTYEMLRVNDSTDPRTGQPLPEHHSLDFGEHDVTISTGPSYQSERDAANNFIDTLATIPVLFARVADLAVKTKDLGPIGDEIAQRLTPADIAAQEKNGEPLPPQAQAIIQQTKAQVTQLDAAVQHLQQENAKLQQEHDAKVLELQSKERIAAMDHDLKLKEMETRITVAEIGTKQQDREARRRLEFDMWKVVHGASHDVGMSLMDQQHQIEQRAEERAAAEAAAAQEQQGSPPPQAASPASVTQVQ